MNRREILDLLAALPPAPETPHAVALGLLEARQLMGVGLGWVDVHLLASALLGGIPLWTLDRPLGEAAVRVGVWAAPRLPATTNFARV
jgi:hypothetical protein